MLRRSDCSCQHHLTFSANSSLILNMNPLSGRRTSGNWLRVDVPVLLQAQVEGVIINAKVRRWGLYLVVSEKLKRSAPSGWRRGTPARTLPTPLPVSLVPSTRGPSGSLPTSVTRPFAVRICNLRTKRYIWHPFRSDPKMKRVSYIGVLDIAGFEIFGRRNMLTLKSDRNTHVQLF